MSVLKVLLKILVLDKNGTLVWHEFDIQGQRNVWEFPVWYEWISFCMVNYLNILTKEFDFEIASWGWLILLEYALHQGCN